MIQHFIQNVAEVTTFGAIAIMIVGGVAQGAHGTVEQITGLLDLTTYFR